MLIYIHFPFCRSKCDYCDFYSRHWQAELVQEYLRLLVREIKMRAEQLSLQKAETLYLGGGTPSLLQAEELERILQALKSVVVLDRDLEFTLEGNPDSCLDLGHLQNLRSLGLNRISLGVQSFKDQDLQFLGRRHNVRQAMQALQTIHKAGFYNNFSLDLLWGLPGQRREDWLEQLRLALQFEPGHMSCYCLSLEPGSRLQTKNQDCCLLWPAESEQATMFFAGAEFLESRGVKQYEIANFAVRNKHCRHNCGYWQGQDYLGLGPGAVSTVQGLRWKNPESLSEYAKILQQKGWPEDIQALTAKQKAQEKLMLALRTSCGLDIEEFETSTGLDLYARNLSLLQALQHRGLLKIENNKLVLTRSGMLLSDAILSWLQLDQEICR